LGETEVISKCVRTLSKTEEPTEDEK